MPSSTHTASNASGSRESRYNPRDVRSSQQKPGANTRRSGTGGRGDPRSRWRVRKAGRRGVPPCSARNRFACRTGIVGEGDGTVRANSGGLLTCCGTGPGVNRRNPAPGRYPAPCFPAAFPTRSHGLLHDLRRRIDRHRVCQWAVAGHTDHGARLRGSRSGRAVRRGAGQAAAGARICRAGGNGPSVFLPLCARAVACTLRGGARHRNAARCGIRRYAFRATAAGDRMVADLLCQHLFHDVVRAADREDPKRSSPVFDARAGDDAGGVSRVPGHPADFSQARVYPSYRARPPAPLGANAGQPGSRFSVVPRHLVDPGG